MSLTKQQALEMFESDDLIGVGMEADAVRRKLHPEKVVTYIIDRNINYTNFCTEYCTFCAFYRPLKGPAAKEGYILDFDTIYEKIRETVELGGTGVLMQGGLHPDLKIDWHEKMLRGIKERFPKIHLHCYSASEIIAIAEYSGLSIRDTILRLRDAGLDSIPGGGAEILDDEVRYKIARLKCLTEDWINVHRTAHQIGMRTTATMMFGVGEKYEHRINHLQKLYELQEETGGFTAFIPWSFQPANTALGGLGRSDGGGISEGAGDFASVSFQLPQRAVELGYARLESVPDGVAVWRERRGIRHAGRECGACGGRDELHD
jgi:cyclic dehypoxanthinyl futalosine synthase